MKFWKEMFQSLAKFYIKIFQNSLRGNQNNLHSECIQNQTQNVFLEAKFRPLLRTTTANFLFSRRAQLLVHFRSQFSFDLSNVQTWLAGLAVVETCTVQSTIPSCSGACASREHNRKKVLQSRNAIFRPRKKVTATINDEIFYFYLFIAI